ncbi:MAG: DUF362 domain-containing protein [Clostridia bacterium]|nr:DUF362 domain-containing protein [Clostridia bacterium]
MKEKVKVYFTKEITPESLVKIYEAVGKSLPGNVGIKISTGEPGGHNYLKPELIKDIVSKLNGTIVENCTAYGGKRQRLEDHLKCVEDHGFTKIAKVDILDSEGEFSIPTKTGSIHLREDIVGSHLENYDSILMLSHFKGHMMGGFGGALKNMSIGVASTKGKLNIHSAGAENQEQEYVWSHLPAQDDFLESMAEACSAVMDYYDNKGGIVYINVINNLSVDCDCDSNPEEPCMKDIGIVASLDPVAIDRASLDLIYKSNDPGREHFLERVETRHGAHTIEHAVTLGLGTTFYEMVSIDK